ncbi:MAG: aryl-sulfate sulfotransferase [Eubacterium sp.]|nr:aryl-sulfate sulfotransferase [Eubacterium sp.]
MRISNRLKEEVKARKAKWQIQKNANRKTVIHGEGGTITLRPKEWVEHGALEYEGLFGRKEKNAYRGNIREEKMYSLTSQSKDWFLELKLRSDKYTFKNMLAVIDPYNEAPLTALVMFSTITDYRVRATVFGDIEETNFVYEYPSQKRHRIPLLGLYPGRETKVRLELLDEQEMVCDTRTFMLKTDPLPEDLKDVITVSKMNKKSAFQNILVAGGIDIRPCVFDREGKIRYYLRRKPKGYGIFPLSKGRFLFMEQDISAPSFTNPHSIQMYDMDFLGRVGRTYFVENGAHHTVEEKTPDGNLLTAGNSLEGHSEDLVLEIDRTTGKILHTLKLEDVFDETYQDMMDWAHINSASYDEEQDSMLVSMRNIHSVAKFDWSTNEMKWLMADPRFWEGTPMVDKLLKPIGDVPWFYQQHAVFEVNPVSQPEEDIRYIMVFDNHWHKRRKVKFFDKDKQSYISFYEINEKEKTVKLFKRIPCPKSKIRSNAIFAEEERRVYIMAGFLVPEIDENLGLIREVDFDTEEVLSEYYVKPGFFRAHEFCPDMTSLSKALVQNTDYLLGDLKRPVLAPKEMCERWEFEQAPSVNHASICYRRREDVLYVREVDHLIQKVIFCGKENVWYVDFGDTYQTMKTFENAVYYIAMWMDVLPSDQYDIYLEIEDKLQKTGKKIWKQK